LITNASTLCATSQALEIFKAETRNDVRIQLAPKFWSTGGHNKGGTSVAFAQAQYTYGCKIKNYKFKMCKINIYYLYVQLTTCAKNKINTEIYKIYKNCE
jgi:hypothetical protein